MSQSHGPSTNSTTSQTDYELLQETFKKLGIEVDLSSQQWRFESEKLDEPSNYIKIDEGIGYGHFYTVFFFDKNGRFITHGVWE